MQFQDEHVFWQGSGQWAFLKRAQGFLGRAESKTVSVDISCCLACSHGCTSAVDAPGTRAGWRRSKSLIRAGSCYRPDRNARHGEHGNRVWLTLMCLGLQVVLVFVGLSSFHLSSPQASLVPDWTQEVLKPQSRKVNSLFRYMGYSTRAGSRTGHRDGMRARTIEYDHQNNSIRLRAKHEYLLVISILRKNIDFYQKKVVGVFSVRLLQDVRATTPKGQRCHNTNSLCG